MHNEDKRRMKMRAQVNSELFAPVFCSSLYQVDLPCHDLVTAGAWAGTIALSMYILRIFYMHDIFPNMGDAVAVFVKKISG